MAEDVVKSPRIIQASVMVVKNVVGWFEAHRTKFTNVEDSKVFQMFLSLNGYVA